MQNYSKKIFMPLFLSAISILALHTNAFSGDTTYQQETEDFNIETMDQLNNEKEDPDTIEEVHAKPDLSKAQQFKQWLYKKRKMLAYAIASASFITALTAGSLWLQNRQEKINEAAHQKRLQKRKEEEEKATKLEEQRQKELARQKQEEKEKKLEKENSIQKTLNDLSSELKLKIESIDDFSETIKLLKTEYDKVEQAKVSKNFLENLEKVTIEIAYNSLTKDDFSYIEEKKHLSSEKTEDEEKIKTDEILKSVFSEKSLQEKIKIFDNLLAARQNEKEVLIKFSSYISKNISYISKKEFDDLEQKINESTTKFDDFNSSYSPNVKIESKFMKKINDIKTSLPIFITNKDKTVYFLIPRSIVEKSNAFKNEITKTDKGFDIISKHLDISDQEIFVYVRNYAKTRNLFRLQKIPDYRNLSQKEIYEIKFQNFNEKIQIILSFDNPELTSKLIFDLAALKNHKDYDRSCKDEENYYKKEVDKIYSKLPEDFRKKVEEEFRKLEAKYMGF